MRVLVAAVMAAAVSAGGASAQSVRDDDYGALVRRATEGRDPVVEEVVVVEEEREAAPPRRSAPRAESRRLDPEPEERGTGMRLHSPSEYASEPHRVTVVDRSRFPVQFRPATVPNTIGLPVGAILVDAAARQLYFGLPDGSLRRYGVAVGKAGAAWHGRATVGRTARWPDWRPTANIRRENRRLAKVVRGGASNPLGARALYLYQGDRDTMYRIHGTNVPSSIGRFASHGCIRMINEDVIELHSMVRPGAVVIVK